LLTKWKIRNFLLSEITRI